MPCADRRCNPGIACFISSSPTTLARRWQLPCGSPVPVPGRGDTLHVHFGQGREQSPLAAHSLLHGLAVEAALADLRRIEADLPQSRLYGLDLISILRRREEHS